MSYDISDFDPFLNHSGCQCGCGGSCGCGDSMSYDGGCGCTSNFSGDEFLGLSIRQDPNAIASEGDPVETQVDVPAVVTEPTPEKTVLLGINKKHAKILAIAAIGFLSYKYLLKPNLK